MGQIGPNWIKLDQIWSNLEKFVKFDHFDQIWSILDQFIPIWSNLDQFGPISSNLIQFVTIWSNLIHFRPICTNLIKFDPICTNLNQFDPVPLFLWGKKEEKKIFLKRFLNLIWLPHKPNICGNFVDPEWGKVLNLWVEPDTGGPLTIEFLGIEE